MDNIAPTVVFAEPKIKHICRDCGSLEVRLTPLSNWIPKLKPTLSYLSTITLSASPIT